MKIRCNKCGKEKKKSEYHNDRKRPNGIRQPCRLCKGIKYSLEERRAKNGKKICIKCEKVQDVSQFGPSKTAADGYYPYCRTCKKGLDSEGYYKFHERRKRRGREYLSQPHVKKHRRKYEREFRIKNLAYIRTVNRIHPLLGIVLNRKECEELLGCDLEFYEKHLDKMLEEKGFTREDRNWHLDHIVPFKTIQDDLFFDSDDRDEIYNRNKDLVKSITNWKNVQVLSKDEHRQKSIESGEYANRRAKLRRK